MQRAVVYSVILLWLGQFVWRQAQSILHIQQLAGSVRARSPTHSTSHNYNICSLARRSLRRPSQVLIQRTLVGEINAAPTSGQKHSVYCNKRKTIQNSGFIVIIPVPTATQTDRHCRRRDKPNKMDTFHIGVYVRLIM
jgi:hypothetical protein